MKTSIDLPDDLFIAAKKKAAELRQPVRMLIESGLRSELRQKRSGKAPARRRIRWITVEGGLPKDVDISSREEMHEWIRKQK